MEEVNQNYQNNPMKALTFIQTELKSEVLESPHFLHQLRGSETSKFYDIKQKDMNTKSIHMYKPATSKSNI